MKKLLKSKKALSPVVAAIILIAVTVAVSIAVAAWMGSLTFTFMETEQITITSVEFDLDDDVITVNVQNTGTTDVTLVSATVSGATVTADDLDTVAKGDDESFDITLTADDLSAGTAYNIQILSTKGNKFAYTATA